MQTTNTIGDLALAMPKSIPVLERLGIDYCCHGAQTIQQACNAASITAEELLRMIDEQPGVAPERTWTDASLSEIVGFINGTHHIYTRSAVHTLRELATRVRGVHGARHPELVKLEEKVHAIAADLLPHMLKEEQVLFPFINALDEAMANGTQPPAPFFGTVKNPVRMMMLEHETVGELMVEVRTLSNDFTLPADACRSYTAFYNLLQEFEQDLHRHIHLENNVLFPRALEAEAKFAPAPFADAPFHGVCGGDHACSE